MLVSLWTESFVQLKKLNRITKAFFLRIFGHADFIKQKVRWHGTIYTISIFHLQRLQRYLPMKEAKSRKYRGIFEEHSPEK